MTQWTTPRRLEVYRASIVLTAVLFFLAGEGTLRRAVSTMVTIGKNAGPSIIAAQEINASLADLDASAANVLLGEGQLGDRAMATFEEQRTRATRRLVDAAENITFGEDEKAPILVLFEQLGRYLELFGEARARHRAGDQQGAVAAYRSATDVMQKTILPAGDGLDLANRREMDHEYRVQRSTDSASEAIALLLGAFVLGALGATQVFVRKRFRRRVSPPLAAASLLAAGYTVYAIQVFGQANTDLRIAKEDAFESIRLLYRMRAIAYAANGDASRALLDPARADTYDQAFRQRMTEISSAPDLDARSITALEKRGAKASFDGLAARIYANVTFPNERPAVIAMLRGLSEWYSLDKTLRGVARGSSGEAIVRRLGSGPNDAPAVFVRFESAIQATIDVNRREFDEVMGAGLHSLRVAEYVNPIVAVLISLLGILGIRPRLREYDA